MRPSIFRGLTLFLFGCVSLSGLAGCQGDASSASAAERIGLTPCEIAGYPGPARCGSYTVWENRAARAGRRIALRILILPARQTPAKPDPVFYFDGGPGGSAVNRAAGIARLLRNVLEQRDLVFVDVRGTGRSNPLNCPGPSADAPLQEFFEDFLSEPYVRRCLAQLEGTADVRFYTQPIAMDDIDEVRAALGYRQINLFGTSGGTRQEQLYMRRHASSVRAVVMHGVQAMDSEMPLGFSRALEHGIHGLLDVCEGDSACRGAYPSLRADWEAVQSRFASGFVEATAQHPTTESVGRVRISKGVFADGLRHMLYDLSMARTIPGEIQRAARGDFDAFAARELRQRTRFASTLSHGMFITATCAEDVRFIDDTDVQRATSDTFLGDYRVRQQQAACRMWPRGEGIDADFQKPVTLGMPVLLISGELDVATTPSEAERVARALPNARHVIFPAQGHNLANPACAARLISDLLESLDPAALDVRCVGETPRTLFSR